MADITRTEDRISLDHMKVRRACSLDLCGEKSSDSIRGRGSRLNTAQKNSRCDLLALPLEQLIRKHFEAHDNSVEMDTMAEILRGVRRLPFGGSGPMQWRGGRCPATGLSVPLTPLPIQMMDEGPDFEERVAILFRKMDINQNGRA